MFILWEQDESVDPGADVNVWCETKWTTRPLTILKHTAMATTGIVVLDMERVRG